MRATFGLFYLIHIFSFAQNLVPNSGFEEFFKCPSGFNAYGMPINIPHWFSPSAGTPDYFNECGTTHSKARMNWAGKCDEFSGQGYAGIITYMDRREYREYLSVELTQPLDSGTVYFVQFSFRLSSYSKVSSGNVGLAFTKSPISVKHDKVIPLGPALVAMPDSAIVKETGRWQTASGNYVANGNERFIVIGNFLERSPIYRLKYGGNQQPMLQSASFYYFDDVIVQPHVSFLPDIPIVLEEEDLFESDSTIVLKNVQFAYNSDQLNSASGIELNRLLNFLLKNPEAKIEVYGHTDDQGSDEYNLDLSARRARAVFDFLVSQDISPGRMKYFGFGKSQPLINSIEEAARGINRRVEVKLLQ